MLIPLSAAELEMEIMIEKFVTNHDDSIALWEIGIIPHGIYKVKHRLSGGQVIIGNDNFKVAVDQIIAGQILVRRVE